MKHKLLGMFLAFGVFAANAADFYVDANSTVETPDGSQASPYKTIVEAVNAANAKGEATGEATFVYIRALGKDDSGNDIPYVFDDKEDLVLVTATNMTITSWGDEKPLIELAASLGKNVYDATEAEVRGKIFFEPNAITLGTKTKISDKKCNSIDLYCEVKNLRFRFFGQNHDSLEGQSLGAMGKVIRVNGRHCIIDGCEFKAEGSFKLSKSGRCVVGTDNGDNPEGSNSENDRDTVGKYLTIRNCLFDNIKNLSVGAICVSSEGKVNNNVFLDCDRVFYATKQASGGYFVSNKVVNCTKPIMSTGEGYGENSNGEVAYNIFVCPDGVDFFNKMFRGFTGTPKIHHNTVVGARNFINVENIIASNGNETTWKPEIYDNLIILKGDGGVICENTAKLKEGLTTSFKPGAFFEGNVYCAAQFISGTAKENELYDISAGLRIGDNTSLGEVPYFLETEDVYSPDFYRLNEARYSWVRKEDAFVGAVEPIALALGLSVDDFSISGEKFAVGSEIEFSIVYSLNQGSVYIYWDFDGDGVYDAEGFEPSCKHTFFNGGSFRPVVKIVDQTTGAVVTKEYPASPLAIGGSLIYVDALADADGDGSKERPYLSIAKAAQVALADSIIFVRGGQDRRYLIDSFDDLVVIDKPNITIKSWGENGNPIVEVSPNLASTLGVAPSIFKILADASGVVVSEIDFVWYGETEEASESFNDKGGYLIDVYGDFVTVEKCSFKQEGAIKQNADKCWAVYAHAGQNSPENAIGKNLKVVNCFFSGESGNAKQLQSIHCGVNPEIIGNVYTNCHKMFYALKGNLCDFSFVSNKIVECSSLDFRGGNWRELQKGVIAYNTFVTTKGDPFIVRENFGLVDKESYIHHNTVIGSTNFVHITNVGIGSFDSWCPRMHDNLIVLGKDGVLFREDGDVLKDTHSSSFKTDGGATFNNNAYLSSNKISIGTATELEGYDLSKGLTIEKNRVLTEVPRFLSTDLNSPDYYRLKSRKGDWAFATATGGYPNYVGAIEPQLMADGFSIVVR